MTIRITYYDINGEENHFEIFVHNATDLIAAINATAQAGNFIIEVCEVR